MSPAPTPHASPTVNVPRPSRTFVTIDEPTLTHRNHPDLFPLKYLHTYPLRTGLLSPGPPLWQGPRSHPPSGGAHSIAARNAAPDTVPRPWAPLPPSTTGLGAETLPSRTPPPSSGCNLFQYIFFSVYNFIFLKCFHVIKGKHP